MSHRLEDGFATLIGFAEDADVSIWEVEVQPPGLDGGGSIDTTTMRNTLWRTMSPKALVTLKECKLKVSYDPTAYNAILAMLNVNQLITLTFPDGTTIAFWGWISEFQPDSHKEGTMPLADITLIPSNQDNSYVETPPAIT